MNPIFNECVCKIQEALNEVEKIDSIAKDPECFINLHFEKNKAHVNWRRNELIADINKYSDQLIQENESDRSQCLQPSAQTNDIARKIDFLKEELFELKKQFDTFDKSSIHMMQDVARLRCERTKNVAIHLKDRLGETLKDYQEFLLLKNELLFGFLDQPVEDIVGKMFAKKQIVTTDEQLEDQNQPHRNDEILPGNVALSQEVNENGKTGRQLDVDNLVKKEVEISNELPTVLEEQQEQLEQRQSQPDIQNNNQCESHLSNSITLNGFAYKSYSKKSKFLNTKTYYCEKSYKKCRAKVTLYPDGRKIQQNKHICRNKPNIIHEYENLGDSTFKINGYSYQKMHGLNVKRRKYKGFLKKKDTEYFACVKKENRCRGSVHAIISNRIIVKQIGHTCGKTSPIISKEKTEPLATEDNPIMID